MNFWEKITGSDMTKKFKTFELRVENYQLIIKMHGMK